MTRNPGNSGNQPTWCSEFLEILEIRGFLIFAILEMWEIEVSIIPRVLEIRAAGGRRRAGGSRGCVVLPWTIFGTCFLEFLDILEILEI